HFSVVGVDGVDDVAVATRVGKRAARTGRRAALRAAACVVGLGDEIRDGPRIVRIANVKHTQPAGKPRHKRQYAIVERIKQLRRGVVAKARSLIAEVVRVFRVILRRDAGAVDARLGAVRGVRDAAMMRAGKVSWRAISGDDPHPRVVESVWDVDL